MVVAVSAAVEVVVAEKEERWNRSAGERKGATVAPSGRTMVGVATCGGASSGRAGGSVA